MASRSTAPSSSGRGLLVLAALLAAAPAAAQDRVLDEGAFRVEVGGKVGRETFRLWATGTGRRLEGHLELETHEGPMAVDYALAAGPPGTPWFESYEVETRFESSELSSRLEVRFDEGALLVESGTDRATVEDWPGQGLVLDNNAIAPFLFLVEAGAREVPVLVPQLGGGMKVVVERRDDREGLVRWFVATPGHGFSLWTDRDLGLVGYRNPTVGLEAWREGTDLTKEARGVDEAVRREEVSFSGAGRRARNGTLTLPLPPNRRSPGVLLLSDAGVHDRRGNPAGTAFRWDHLDQLAVALARAGYAVLATDDDAAIEALSDLAADAGAALRFLRAHENVDPRRIAAIGHGEGGLVALALSGERGGTSAVVLVGTPARPFAEIVLDRELAALESRGVSERERERFRAGRAEALARIAASSGEELETEDGPIRVRALRERLRFDALARVRELEAGVLVLSPAFERAEADLFARTLAEARHPNHVVRAVEGVDSLLLPVRFGPADLSDFDRRLDPGALRAIEDFLGAVLGR